ncbi:hypothetical protein ABIB00_004052 [Bradyrhizobium sp. LB14.3]|uniref:hypothetical protein n=1 Tax=Bradyrhizobium sp. LB14.3 TaxID=3156328 RepID=UPI003393785A
MSPGSTIVWAGMANLLIDFDMSQLGSPLLAAATSHEADVTVLSQKVVGPEHLIDRRSSNAEAELQCDEPMGA